MKQKEIYKYALKGIYEEWLKIKRDDFETREDWSKALKEMENKYKEVSMLLANEQE